MFPDDSAVFLDSGSDCVHCGKPITSDQETIPHTVDEPDFRIIDVFISKLRQKLSSATGGENYIDTEWGRGYVLRDPEEMGVNASAA